MEQLRLNEGLLRTEGFVGPRRGPTQDQDCDSSSPGAIMSTSFFVACFSSYSAIPSPSVVLSSMQRKYLLSDRRRRQSTFYGFSNSIIAACEFVPFGGNNCLKGACGWIGKTRRFGISESSLSQNVGCNFRVCSPTLRFSGFRAWYEWIYLCCVSRTGLLCRRCIAPQGHALAITWRVGAGIPRVVNEHQRSA